MEKVTIFEAIFKDITVIAIIDVIITHRVRDIEDSVSAILWTGNRQRLGSFLFVIPAQSGGHNNVLLIHEQILSISDEDD